MVFGGGQYSPSIRVALGTEYVTVDVQRDDGDAANVSIAVVDFRIEGDRY